MGSGTGRGPQCIKDQSFSVRSVVVLSLHQNGLSIGPSDVFGTYGFARRYRFENTVYFSAPKIQPDLRVEENEQAA